jgi:hypothetical protein
MLAFYSKKLVSQTDLEANMLAYFSLELLLGEE